MGKSNTQIVGNITTRKLETYSFFEKSLI